MGCIPFECQEVSTLQHLVAVWNWNSIEPADELRRADIFVMQSTAKVEIGLKDLLSIETEISVVLCMDLLAS
jgi:hypothetical protein